MNYADYCQIRMDRLCETDTYVTLKLEEDRDRLCRQVDSRRLDQQSPLPRESLCDMAMVTLTLRYAMLMAACTFLEETVRFLSKKLIGNYKADLRAQKHGSWLHRHLQVLNSRCDLDLAPIGQEKALFEDIIQIRNAIAHAWGKIDACKNARQIHAITSQYDWLRINSEGYIDLRNQAVPEALVAATDIVEHILELPGASSLTWEEPLNQNKDARPA
jgi:hypothetical protein